MNPDIDLRLSALTKSLLEVVLPALPAHERLARDQVQLVVGHLAMFAQQWKYALRFERDTLRATRALAEELLPLVDDAALVASVTAALAAATTLDADDYDALSAANRALCEVLDHAIAGIAPRQALSAALQRAVLDYGDRQAARERPWFAGNGLDPDAATLPPFASLFERSA